MSLLATSQDRSSANSSCIFGFREVAIVALQVWELFVGYQIKAMCRMSSFNNSPVAILYQAALPPVKNGIIKPMKPGGYSDSGADMAFTLQQAGIPVVTPVRHPDPTQVYDWVFPDTRQGIEQALTLGAKRLWLNTILFETHPIQYYLNQGIPVVGQDPSLVELYDDKWDTNALLRSKGLPIPSAHILQRVEELESVLQQGLLLPVVAKPIRGRGSAGVSLIHTPEELRTTVKAMLQSAEFGDAIMIETYLSGQEVTLTVMPPGRYHLEGVSVAKTRYWSLPPVKRFNHQNGIAPYNGVVAVVANSAVVSEEERSTESLQVLMRQCEQAAGLVSARAPIRIDCRQDNQGTYYLFDLNMKPNMTGAGRPGRKDQDSLSALAARSIGWSYPDLLVNMLAQQWHR